MDDYRHMLEAHQQGDWPRLEVRAREALARKKFFYPHLFLIFALLMQGKTDEADAEFEALAAYKFNLSERIGMFPELEQRYRQRLEGHYVMNAMHADMSFEGEAMYLDVRRWPITPMGSGRDVYLAVAETFLKAALPEQARVDAKTASICTFGSCFAANLAKMMVSQGINATNLLIEESINSTYANRALLEIVSGSKDSSAHEQMRQEFGQDFFPTVRDKLAAASHIVLTVGVAPSFFNVASGAFVFAKHYSSLLREGRIRMRTTTCSENLENLRHIIAHMNAVAPRARKIITVSPVPLMATSEMPSVVMADCISKSTLRAAVHELVTTDPSLTYFPAFEIVRWLSAHSGAEVFGADDGNTRHVSNWLVEFIVSSFINRFFIVA